MCIIREVQYIVNKENGKTAKTKEIHWGEEHEAPFGARIIFWLTLVIGVVAGFIIIFTG